MAVADYATLDDLRAHLGLTTVEWDVKLQLTVTAVSRWIDEYCHRHFWQETESRVFEGCGGKLLRLGESNDLVSVSLIATDSTGDGIFDDVWLPSEFQLLSVQPLPTRPYTQIRALGRSFPRSTSRLGLVQISGVWGWPTVPTPVKQACLIQTARVFKRKDSPEGVTGFDQFGVVRVAARPDADVAHLLNPYRHPMGIAVIA